MADDISVKAVSPFWLERLQALDETAWLELVNNSGDMLRRDIEASLRKRGLSSDLVNDIEQDMWRAALQKIGEFYAQTPDKLYHWLRVIALNRVRMLRRAQKPTTSFEEVEDGEFEQGGMSLDRFLYTSDLCEDSPEAEVLLRERVSALQKALRKLSDRDHEILLRRLLDGMTPMQLAAIYHVEPRSISMILHRAKQTLERQLRLMESSRKEKEQ